MADPSAEQTEGMMRLAREMPTTDPVFKMALAHDLGFRAQGDSNVLWVMRRMICEVIQLRMLVRKLSPGVKDGQ